MICAPDTNRRTDFFLGLPSYLPIINVQTPLLDWCVLWCVLTHAIDADDVASAIV